MLVVVSDLEQVELGSGSLVSSLVKVDFEGFDLGVLDLTFSLDLLSELLETVDGLLILLFFVLELLSQFSDLPFLVLDADHLTIDSGLEVTPVGLTLLSWHGLLL